MPDVVEFELHPDERDLILGHTFPPEHIARRLKMGIHGPSGLIYRFSPEEFEQLVDCIGAEAGHAKSRKLECQFDALYDKLTAIAEEFAPPEDGATGDGDTEFLSRFPPHVRDAVQGILDDPRFTSIEQINAALEAVMQTHNRTPLAEFAGLSPEQLFRLSQASWDNSSEAFCIRDDLTMADVADVEIFRNARVMLRALGREGTPATKSGSLNTKFVAQMAREMDYPRLDIERELSRRHFEEDFGQIGLIRHLLTYARLVRKHRDRFVRTKAAAKLLDDDQAGRLYALLLRTMFRQYDISFPYYPPEFCSLQWALPFPVYVLSRFAVDWQDVAGLAPRLLLITAVPYIDESDFLFNTEELARRFILRPLWLFGLVESREATRGLDIGAEIRITPLFQRVFSLRI